MFWLPLLLLLLCSALGGLRPLHAQTDTVRVAAGPHYAAGRLHGFLLGEDYRDLWTVPIAVPVLDLRTFAGGLTPVRRGGGKQTISLRLRGADGKEYVFRSVDKDQTGGLPRDFQESLVDRVIQDQVSSKHPAAGLVAHALQSAVGILHAPPSLRVMPDDPRLGEFRAVFAGMLGTLEERPDEEENGGAFAGADQVVGTERLFEQLEEDPRNRVDSRAFLTVRLMDFLMGDWDRHMDQWRWARFDRDGRRVFHPIPRDRDNAFSDYDGALLRMVRGAVPSLIEWGPRYSSIEGLTLNAQPLDRQLLSDLPREVFDSTALALQRALPDPVIEAAVAAGPREYYELGGAELVRGLRARRDNLPEIARRFYALLSQEVDVWATDEPERAEIERAPDGSVEVSLFSPAAVGDGLYFRRRFRPEQTREVRVYLRGGDDHLVVRGSAPRSVVVRVVGGGGDDVLVDSSRVSGAGHHTVFYDHRGDNRIQPGREASVDTRDYEPPEVTAMFGNVPPTRDWGSRTSLFSPAAEWRYNVGPVIGGGPVRTRYGFRQHPYASRVAARALYAPTENRVGVELDGEFRRSNSRSRLEVLAAASQLVVTRFHGFGNETPRTDPDRLYKVWETQVRGEALLFGGLTSSAEWFAGPVLELSRPEVEPGSPAAADGLPGSRSFGQAGARLGAVLDTRDLPSYPRRGLYALASTSVFPAVWDLDQGFGRVDVQSAAFVPLPAAATLALRLGGSVARGAFPFQEAAFVGGSETLRGYPRQRFAGDASAFAGAELRGYVGRFNFISRGDWGVLAFADAGRVFVEGERSDTWHTGAGGGVWIGVLERTRTASLVVARGEETTLYLGFGLPF